MSKGKGKGKDVDWVEESEGSAGDEGVPGDAELEELESEALDAGDDPDEDDADGNREDASEGNEPTTLEEARERLADLEARRKDENIGMRRQITKLRRRGREQRLYEDPRGAPTPQTPELKIPDSMTLEIDDNGKPVLSQAQIKELVEAQRFAQTPQDTVRPRAEIAALIVSIQLAANLGSFRGGDARLLAQRDPGIVADVAQCDSIDGALTALQLR